MSTANRPSTAEFKVFGDLINNNNNPSLRREFTKQYGPTNEASIREFLNSPYSKVKDHIHTAIRGQIAALELEKRAAIEAGQQQESKQIDNKLLLLLKTGLTATTYHLSKSSNEKSILEKPKQYLVDLYNRQINTIKTELSAVENQLNLANNKMQQLAIKKQQLSTTLTKKMKLLYPNLDKLPSADDQFKLKQQLDNASFKEKIEIAARKADEKLLKTVQQSEQNPAYRNNLDQYSKTNQQIEETGQEINQLSSEKESYQNQLTSLESQMRPTLHPGNQSKKKDEEIQNEYHTDTNNDVLLTGPKTSKHSYLRSSLLGWQRQRDQKKDEKDLELDSEQQTSPTPFSTKMTPAAV